MSGEDRWERERKRTRLINRLWIAFGVLLVVVLSLKVNADDAALQWAIKASNIAHAVNAECEMAHALGEANLRAYLRGIVNGGGARTDILVFNYTEHRCRTPDEIVSRMIREIAE